MAKKSKKPARRESKSQPPPPTLEALKGELEKLLVVADRGTWLDPFISKEQLQRIDELLTAIAERDPDSILDTGLDSLGLLSTRLIGRFRMALTRKLAAGDGQVLDGPRTRISQEVLAVDVPNLERIAHLHIRLAAASERRKAFRRGTATPVESEISKSEGDAANAKLRLVKSQ